MGLLILVRRRPAVITIAGIVITIVALKTLFKFFIAVFAAVGTVGFSATVLLGLLLGTRLGL